jgi:hypothetical protein
LGSCRHREGLLSPAQIAGIRPSSLCAQKASLLQGLVEQKRGCHGVRTFIHGLACQFNNKLAVLTTSTKQKVMDASILAD